MLYVNLVKVAILLAFLKIIIKLGYIIGNFDRSLLGLNNMVENLKSIPEINLRVIIIGVMLSIVMGSANVYLGLKAGMTVSASIPAAVLGMLIIKYINSNMLTFFKSKSSS